MGVWEGMLKNRSKSWIRVSQLWRKSEMVQEGSKAKDYYYCMEDRKGKAKRWTGNELW